MEEEELEVANRIGNYVIESKIASGSFATVYRARHCRTLVPVALKCIPKCELRSLKDFEFFQREVLAMNAMDHPYVATFYELLDDDRNCYLSMEFVPNGDLLTLISQKGLFAEDLARRYFRQLVSVLFYLHREKHVMHRDLKTENILLDDIYNIRVIDFGFAKQFTSDNPWTQTSCGSPAYVAPEVIQERPYTAAADIWSLGIILYVMVVGRLPFDVPGNVPSTLEAVLLQEPRIPSSLSPELQMMLSMLLVKEPEDRITLDGIICHPWMNLQRRLDNRDSSFIDEEAKVVQDILDETVCTEMRVCGYDTSGGLLSELTNGLPSSRAAAYKMLKRNRMLEEWRDISLTGKTKHVEHTRSIGAFPQLKPDPDLFSPLTAKPNVKRKPFDHSDALGQMAATGARVLDCRMDHVPWRKVARRSPKNHGGTFE